MTGRPTSFKEEMIQQAEEYIDHGYKELGHEIPSHMGLAKILKVNRSTLYEWGSKKDHPFSNILEKCNIEQCLILISNGLNGNFNSNITKLVLGKHGYSEKTDNKNTDTVNLTISSLDAETL